MNSPKRAFVANFCCLAGPPRMIEGGTMGRVSVWVWVIASRGGSSQLRRSALWAASAMVSDVPCQLPRSGTQHAPRPRESRSTTRRSSEWIQAYAAELEKRTRPHLRMSNGSWRVDETYVRVKGRLDVSLSGGGTAEGRRSISFWLRGEIRPRPSGFFRKAIAQPHVATITEPSLSTRILPIPERSQI